MISSPPTYDEIQKLLLHKAKEGNGVYFFDGNLLNHGNNPVLKLSQIVSALANTGEASIYCGITQRRGRAVQLNPVTVYFDENWLLHEIQSNIQMPVKGMKIYRIDTPVSGEYLFYITIPHLNNAPHMFADSKYYKWYRRRCESMTEGEVRMYYHAAVSPELDFVGIYNTNGLPVLLEGAFKTISFYPKLLIQNKGGAMEKDYKIEVFLPTELHDVQFMPLQSKLTRHEGVYSVFSVSAANALYQEEVANPLEIKILVSPENFNLFCKEYLSIRVYYSKGVTHHDLKLSDTFTYNGHRLQKEDFINKASLPQTELF